MKIEAVTVCVNYSDFLRAAAPVNRPLLDRWIVVTTPSDEETRAACRAFSIECVVSEDHQRTGNFGKGRLIDRGLAMIEGGEWQLHLDADIALPHDFHQVLDDAHLDESHLYGCDRLNVTGYQAWQRVLARGLWCRSNAWGVELDRPDTKPGCRVANAGHGYTPIGFFQLWHGSDSNWHGMSVKRYPMVHGTAARTDVKHALQWDRRRRSLIPELLVWHLESEPAKMGANWNGRKTAKFGPASPSSCPTPYARA